MACLAHVKPKYLLSIPPLGLDMVSKRCFAFPDI